MQGIEWIELFIAMMLSTAGGVVRKFTELERNPDQQITLRQYMLSSAISCFVGIVVFALLRHFEMSMLLIIAIVAIAGFIGSPVIHVLSSAFMSRLKKKTGEYSKDSEKTLLIINKESSDCAECGKKDD